MIAIIDYGSGNITSVQMSLQRLQIRSQLTSDPTVIAQATHVILPGVGAAKAAMEQLNKYHLANVIRNLRQPVLGICLGMQLFYAFSTEGNVNCLNIIEGKVEKLNPVPQLAVPHMGWNKVKIAKDSSLFCNVKNESYFYFVHSYAAGISSITTAQAVYNQNFAAAIEYKNFYGVQFHPEKSGEVGERLLQNFLKL